MAALQQKKERHRSFHLSFKLRAIEVAEKKSKEAAAREFDVDPKQIREWCKKKNELMALSKTSGSKSRKRLRGGCRRFRFEDMEESLLSWITELRERNLRVSRRMIVEQAKSLVTVDAAGVPFKASMGWLRHFMKRHGL